MSDLTRFRDHCRKMATAEHKPECPSLPANQPYWPMWHGIYDANGDIEALGWNGPPPPAPTCDGCLTDADRTLFGDLTTEPEPTPTQEATMQAANQHLLACEAAVERAHQLADEWEALAAGRAYDDGHPANRHGDVYAEELRAALTAGPASEES